MSKNKKPELSNDEYFAKVNAGEILTHTKPFGPDATASNLIKYVLCQGICHFSNQHNDFNQYGLKDYTNFARITGLSIIRVKMAAHSNYDDFTIEELLEAWLKLKSKLNATDDETTKSISEIIAGNYEV